jgi:type II secretory ATPase GspE/PulE/Tfp pilus assembly ATPase PilB-like protein
MLLPTNIDNRGAEVRYGLLFWAEEVDMENLSYRRNQLATLKEQAAYNERFKLVITHVHAAKDVDQILVTLHDDILSLFDAERLALYAVDAERKEVYSRFSDLDKVQEIRVPLNNQSLVGFVARHRQSLNVTNAYDQRELTQLHSDLTFDYSWDQRSGLRTQQVLTVPIHAPSNRSLAGVIQLINKKNATRFTTDDERKVRELAVHLGAALQKQYQLAPKQFSKFSALVTNNLLSQGELEMAMAEAREQQRPVEAILLGTYQVRKQDLSASLSAYYQCPFFDPENPPDLNLDVVRRITPVYLNANSWIPLRIMNDMVEILIDDPQSSQYLNDIRLMFPGKKPQFIVGLKDDILKVIKAINADLAANAAKATLNLLLSELAAERHTSIESLTDATGEESDSAVVRLVNQLISDAYKAGASDIHIEPQGDQNDTIVRFRIDGHCQQERTVPARHRRTLASRLKVMAQLDIAERRKPQDGKILFRLPDREIELRVATLPTAGNDNEDVVLRILTARDPIYFDNLGMSERNLQAFKHILRKPYGMILCVGPTGSGKTTTLHSALAQINTPDRKIWTAEDPVEITQRGLRQVQVHPRIGFDFAAAMRAFLRADPDVIMVGEIRDRETAEMSIEASLTGHLVLSTLHTNSAVETVTRLLEMQMDPFLFADALLGVLAQRLTQTICRTCKEAYHPPKEEYEALAYGYGEVAFAQLGVRYDDSFRLFRGKGCQMCRKTGYRGRMGLHELLIATDEIKTLIHARATVLELLKVAVAQGMTTLVQDGIRKILEGWTDYKQVQAVAIR